MFSSAPDLSIIVISYNTRDMTLACLRSVFEETKTPFEIVVVDNDSSDGSVAAIAEAFPNDTFPNLTLLAEKTNHGFAAAHTLALEHTQAPWLLLLNPDTVVLDGAIDTLRRFADKRPNAGIWGGRTIHADGSLNPTSCWRRMSLWTVFCRTTGLTGLFPRSEFFNAECYGAWARDTERDVDIITGCFLLIKRETWNRLGGFDSVFVMYGEEADLCLRARALGAEPRLTPEATIIHHGRASEPSAADRMIRVLRAKAELIARHFSTPARSIALPLFSLHPLGRRIFMGAAGSLLGRENLKRQSTLWGEVWTRRHEWKSGFPKT